MSSSQQMDSISATGRTRQKYDQSYCQPFSNGRISLRIVRGLIRGRLLDFRERLGREQLGPRGDEQRRRQPGYESYDMKNQCF